MVSCIKSFSVICHPRSATLAVVTAPPTTSISCHNAIKTLPTYLDALSKLRHGQIHNVNTDKALMVLHVQVGFDSGVGNITGDIQEGELARRGPLFRRDGRQTFFAYGLCLSLYRIDYNLAISSSTDIPQLTRSVYGPQRATFNAISALDRQ